MSKAASTSGRWLREGRLGGVRGAGATRAGLEEGRPGAGSAPLPKAFWWEAASWAR